MYRGNSGDYKSLISIRAVAGYSTALSMRILDLITDVTYSNSLSSNERRDWVDDWKETYKELSKLISTLKQVERLGYSSILDVDAVMTNRIKNKDLAHLSKVANMLLNAREVFKVKGKRKLH